VEAGAVVLVQADKALLAPAVAAQMLVEPQAVELLEPQTQAVAVVPAMLMLSFRATAVLA